MNAVGCGVINFLIHGKPGPRTRARKHRNAKLQANPVRNGRQRSTWSQRNRLCESLLWIHILFLIRLSLTAKFLQRWLNRQLIGS
jgi:hypothetical protein